ncbi:hypothetical protein [Simkania sp.]|uniref:hypothetical protein n=1 Tax=Simkania sp. TaxID=34094 RepID=UPI003B52BA87
MNEIKNIEDLKFSLFAPIDEEYPIVEVLYKDEVLLDLSIDANNPPSINILMHHGSKGILYNFEIFEKILAKAKEKLINAL